MLCISYSFHRLVHVSTSALNVKSTVICISGSYQISPSISETATRSSKTPAKETKLRDKEDQISAISETKISEVIWEACNQISKIQPVLSFFAYKFILIIVLFV